MQTTATIIASVNNDTLFEIVFAQNVSINVTVTIVIHAFDMNVA